MALSERIAVAGALLAPFAVPYRGQLGREHTEPEDDTRTPFQRDRDRIIHSQAFRRLQGKTQVFVAGEGDHFRTRLTHTMEVAQIARDMARHLDLNEDLAETIALAHDLGHPPFGHTGEGAVHAWMQKHGDVFEHNAQSLRIVTTLEEHSGAFLGLNLSREVLEGLQKHRTPHDAPAAAELPRSLSLEAQIVNIADEIAYTAHDCEDGIRAHLFTAADIAELPLTIDALVRDIYAEVPKYLAAAGIRTLDDVYAAKEPLVRFSAQTRQHLETLRAFLWEKMYLHPRVRVPSDEGAMIVQLLLDRLFAAPTDKVLALQKRTESSLAVAVKDYVAGMTDAFARTQAG